MPKYLNKVVIVVFNKNTLNKYRHRTNPGTEAEPQQIVAQGLLSCLQYPVPFKSSTEDLTRPTFGSVVKQRVDQKGYRYKNTGQGEYRRCQHGF